MKNVVKTLSILVYTVHHIYYVVINLLTLSDHLSPKLVAVYSVVFTLQLCFLVCFLESWAQAGQGEGQGHPQLTT